MFYKLVNISSVVKALITELDFTTSTIMQATCVLSCKTQGVELRLKYEKQVKSTIRILIH